ncbi:DUF932 domain-containing protein [Humisphaera borealis]|uniref:DUF932 domain-containing protein n=1 Tax=Humisphaera borealis TaxID=2807512 RepID=A0A7M2WX55_9BACT|nr:DUF932 domain-containing protein [Humisphaera borealis]QOV89782.1 DUF932 domain-containing protein [Humisphaera borealis]
MTMTMINPQDPADLDNDLPDLATITPTPPSPVWERLGVDISRARTATDALKAAGLDWQVQQWPVQATDPQSWKTAPLPDHLANVRSDTRDLLGVVGKTYRVFENRQLFEFLGALVADRLVSFHSAGSLRGGRRVWVLCQLPRVYQAAPDDTVKPFLLVTNTHDGDGPLQMMPATVRDVCANAFNLPLDVGGSGSRGLTIRHHGGLTQSLAEARRNLRAIAARFEQFESELATLAATPVSRWQVADYFASVLAAADGNGDQPTDSRDRLLTRLHENFDGPTNTIPAIAGTAWAAFNAVGEWADSQRTFRGRDDLARAEARLDAIWFGSSHRLKQTAYRSALCLAGLN